MLRRAQLASLAFLFVTALARASYEDATVPSLAELAAAGAKAYQSHDYPGFLSYARALSKRAPDDPRATYNLACAEALAGSRAVALGLLETLAARGVDLGGEDDPDLADLREMIAWPGYRARLARLRTPLVRSSVALRLAERELVTTGIAIDGRAHATYVASLRQRKIVRVSSDGQITDFTRSGQDGIQGAAALLIDPNRRILYISTTPVAFMAGFDAGANPRSGVLAYDLDSGRLLASAWLAPDAGAHFLNQMALDGEGTLYVCDSLTSGVYRWPAGASTLEAFIPTGAFRSTQGIAFAADGRTAYVADFANGLFALDLMTRERRELRAPGNLWLAGLDGLTAVPGGLVAVQLSAKSARVLRIILNPARPEITRVDVLERNRPDYAGPIQGTRDGNAFVYIANSQIALGDAVSGVFDVARAQPTTILRLELPATRSHPPA